MKAVGKILGKNKVGFHQASLYIDRRWMVYTIANPIDCLRHEIGLFSFCPEDQFCKWIDPNKT
jgi:hypothetical protein